MAAERAMEIQAMKKIIPKSNLSSVELTKAYQQAKIRVLNFIENSGETSVKRF